MCPRTRTCCEWKIVRRWHHQLTHLHIHTELVKKCFLKICETSKFHNFLIFQPIFIRFSLFCSENFTLSSEIKLDQLRTSPLRSYSLSHENKLDHMYFWMRFLGVFSIGSVRGRWYSDISSNQGLVLGYNLNTVVPTGFLENGGQNAHLGVIWTLKGYRMCLGAFRPGFI